MLIFPPGTFPVGCAGTRQFERSFEAGAFSEVLGPRASSLTWSKATAHGDADLLTTTPPQQGRYRHNAE